MTPCYTYTEGIIFTDDTTRAMYYVTLSLLVSGLLLYLSFNSSSEVSQGQ